MHDGRNPVKGNHDDYFVNAGAATKATRRLIAQCFAYEARIYGFDAFEGRLDGINLHLRCRCFTRRRMYRDDPVCTCFLPQILDKMFTTQLDPKLAAKMRKERRGITVPRKEGQIIKAHPGIGWKSGYFWSTIRYDHWHVHVVEKEHPMQIPGN